jgi:hypothetical protein
MDRAGELAAEWSLAEVPPIRRRLAAVLPAALRSRLALRLTSRVARRLPPTGAAKVKVRRGRASLSLPASVFCGGRAKVAAPQCDFYRSLAVSALRGFGVAATARIDCCRAVSGDACVIVIDLSGAHREPPAVAA